MPLSQIFLAPCASSRPQANFEKSVKNPVPRETYSQFSSRDFGESIGVWGVTEGKRGTWERISEGDVVLFYTGDGRYEFGAEIVDKEHNRELAMEIWPDFEDTSAGSDDSSDPYEYLIYLNRPFAIEIESSEIHEFADHGQNYPLSFMPLNETGLEHIVTEFGSVDEYLESRRPSKSIWIEKTEIANRDYKQSGPLALGNALIAPSRDQAGRKRYETLRDAEVGDIVLHLLQEEGRIVGVSRIASELQEDFEGPPEMRWTEEQQQAGGYLRELEGFEELSDPIEIYDQVLNNPNYREALDQIRSESRKIVFDKNFQLNQGHYFTRCPDRLASILSTESDELMELFAAKGYEVETFEPLDLEPRSEPYDTVQEATEDVLNRIEIADGEVEKFRDELAKAVVREWTEPLKKIAVQTASEISTDEAVLIRQIKRIYHRNQDWLSDRADELGIGSLFALDPPQVLYLALLRDIQSEVADISQLNFNHVKLKTIFNEEYTVLPTEEDEPEPETDSILSYLSEQRDHVEVHTFTAPPDYWLTALRRRAVSFEEENRNRWDQVSKGDIALFHSTVEPGNPELETQPNGFIGAAILGRKARKTENWWWDEFESVESFPLIVGFERIFTTGAIDEIKQSTTIDQQSDDEIERELGAITSNLLPYSTADDACREKTGEGLNPQGAFSTFDRHDERQDILLGDLAPHLSEISPVNIHFDVRPRFSPEVLEGLHFPENQGEKILGEIQAAIRSGKHVVLTGPPGTGKTEIAERIAEDLAESYPYLYSGAKVTTATADWSTFDTVGGYMPRENGSGTSGDYLAFTPGTILNRLRHSQFDVSINEPLVIDELNRADIDKAFGQLFTVLSGQTVSLPYTRGGQEIELLSVKDLEGLPRRYQYVIPTSWRLLATMNTYDKTSLYEMSYAFMRRFAFIRVGAPDLDGNLLELMRDYTAAWEDAGIEISLADDELLAIGRVWKQTNSAVDERAIGPAIARDLVLYLQNHDNDSLEANLTDAVIAYIFPQLEGVPKRRQIVENIAEVAEIDDDRLRDVGREILQIRFDEVEDRG